MELENNKELEEVITKFEYISDKLKKLNYSEEYIKKLDELMNNISSAENKILDIFQELINKANEKSEDIQ